MRADGTLVPTPPLTVVFDCPGSLGPGFVYRPIAGQDKPDISKPSTFFSCLGGE